MSFDPTRVRADFPILSRQVNGRPLVYLDSGASAQKPQVVIDAISAAYAGEYANVHRGLHFLSNLATDNYERVRAIIARFLNAPHEDEVIFTTGTTEAINLVSYAFAAPRLGPGDEIVLSVLEHHANIVPWHFLRERQGVVLKWVEPEPDGSLPPGARPDDLVIHQSDVQAVVNAMWAAGATGVSVMDQRLIATSAVRCVGNTLLLQGRTYSPPFVVSAVVDSAAAREELAASPQIAVFEQVVDAFGLTYEMRDRPQVELPAYDGALTLQYAAAG